MKFFFCECPRCGETSVHPANSLPGKPPSCEAWCFSCGMFRERDVKMRVRPAKDTDQPGLRDARVSFGVGKGNAQ